MCWFLFLLAAADRDRRRTVAVFVVAAFDVLVAAAVAAVFLAVDMFPVVRLSSFASGDAIVTVTALKFGRSPHGEGQRPSLQSAPADNFFCSDVPSRINATSASMPPAAAIAVWFSALSHATPYSAVGAVNF